MAPFLPEFKESKVISTCGGEKVTEPENTPPQGTDNEQPKPPGVGTPEEKPQGLLIAVLSTVLFASALSVYIPTAHLQGWAADGDRFRLFSVWTVFTPIGGFLASPYISSYGLRRPAFLALTAASTSLSSLAIAYSTEWKSIVLCRIAQSVVAGAILPLAVHLLVNAYPAVRRGVLVGLVFAASTVFQLPLGFSVGYTSILPLWVTLIGLASSALYISLNTSFNPDRLPRWEAGNLVVSLPSLPRFKLHNPFRPIVLLHGHRSAFALAVLSGVLHSVYPVIVVMYTKEDDPTMGLYQSIIWILGPYLVGKTIGEISVGFYSDYIVGYQIPQSKLIELAIRSILSSETEVPTERGGNTTTTTTTTTTTKHRLRAALPASLLITLTALALSIPVYLLSRDTADVDKRHDHMGGILLFGLVVLGVWVNQVLATVAVYIVECDVERSAELVAAKELLQLSIASSLSKRAFKAKIGGPAGLNLPLVIALVCVAGVGLISFCAVYAVLRDDEKKALEALNEEETEEEGRPAVDVHVSI